MNQWLAFKACLKQRSYLYKKYILGANLNLKPFIKTLYGKKPTIKKTMGGSSFLS
jgi:hypothetical protein